MKAWFLLVLLVSGCAGTGPPRLECTSETFWALWPEPHEEEEVEMNLEQLMAKARKLGALEQRLKKLHSEALSAQNQHQFLIARVAKITTELEEVEKALVEIQKQDQVP